MSDLRSVLERGIGGAVPPPDGYERLLRRRDRQRRNQRLGAGVLALVVMLLLAGGFVRSLDTGPAPGEMRPTPSPVITPAPPDAVVDVRTGRTTPMEPISAGQVGDYAISPDGSTLLFDGRDDEGTYCWQSVLGCDITQIFLVGIDGTDVRQLTHEPAGAVAGSWSPDGQTIAYIAGWAQRPSADLYIIDVATGATTRLAERLPYDFNQLPPPRFSPDGRTILYTGEDHDLWTVPVEGGPSTRLHDGGLWGSYSPDGTTIAYLTMTWNCCGESRQEIFAGDAVFLADADGTGARRLAKGPFDRVLWSPDGTRLVAERDEGPDRVVIIDATTGEVTPLITGDRPTWLDPRTLIVE